jgi:hypothetical protein
LGCLVSDETFADDCGIGGATLTCASEGTRHSCRWTGLLSS